MTDPGVLMEYTRGRTTALLGARTALLTDASADEPSIAAAWSVIQGDAAAREALDVLLEHGLRNLSSFVIATMAVDQTPGVAFLRGTGSLCSVGVDGAESLVTGSAGRAYREIVISPDTASVRLAAQATLVESPWLPAAAGILLAGMLRLGQLQAGSSSGGARALAQRAGSLNRGSLNRGVDQARQPLPPAGTNRSDRLAADPGLAVHGSDEPSERGLFDHLIYRRPEPAALQARMSGDAPQHPSTPRSAATLPVADLGSEQGRRVGTSKEDDELHGATARPHVGRHARRVEADCELEVHNEVPVGNEAEIEQATGSIIAAVPWATEPGLRADSPVGVSSRGERPEPRIGASAGKTVDRAALGLPPGRPRGSTVLAATCPNGHLTPPDAPSCRACGTRIDPRNASQVTRPPLGVLRLSTGDAVTLDRGILMGRSPQPRTGPQSAMPHLVALVSPENDISRDHLEIHLDGWQVEVEDLGSTNGTVVQRPGHEPVRLVPGDRLLIEPGTRVVLADELSFDYVVTP